MRRSSRAAARWRALIQEHETSGLTIERFCQERGTTSSSFFRWRHILRQETAVAVAQPTSFLEARVADEAVTPPPTASTSPPASPSSAALPSSAAASIELVLPGDLRLVIRPGFCRSLLLELLQTLQPAERRS